MPFCGLHEDHNEIKLIPAKGRDGYSQSRLSSTCLPNIDVFRGYWPSKSKRKLKLDSTCLLDFGLFEFSELRLPHFASLVSAGYPSPADDSLDTHLDLMKYLIKHPKSTYYFKATGYSMIEAGIFDKDILVVDTAIKPKHGSIVIAVVNGEFTVKRLHTEESKTMLVSANPDYPTITITKKMSFFIQGVVTTVIHVFKPLH